MLKAKKLLIIVLGALLVVSMAAVIAVNASTNPALTVSSHSIDYDADSAARQITVTVSLPENSEYLIAGSRFNIGFDPTVMTCDTSTGITWNVSNGFKTANLAVVNTNLTNLTLVWANDTNISYTTTTDNTAWLVKITFTIADNAPAGVYPITMSFPITGTYEGNMTNAALDDVPTDLVSGSLTINPIPITYTASITGLNGSGEAVYGTTLGASALNITDGRDGNLTTYTEDQISSFTYQWYRDGAAITGATSATYSPTADDIAATDTDIAASNDGCILSVTIGATGNFTATPASSSEVKAVRAAYTGTVPVPVLVSRTTDSITIGISDDTLTNSDCQFKMGTEGTWQDSPTFNSLDNSFSYVFYARVAETTTTLASDASASSATMRPQLSASGTLGIDDTTPAYGETLGAYTSVLDADFKDHGLSTAVYTWYRDSVTAANVVGTGSSYTVVEADIGHTLTLGISAVDNFTDYSWGFTGAVYSSATATVAKANNTATPVTPSVNSNEYVNIGGLVISIQENQEYKITQGGVTVSDWASYTGTTKQFATYLTDWLKPVTDYVITTRFTATSTQNAGTVEQTLNVTTAQWRLDNSALSVSPDSWVYGIEETATGTTDVIEAESSLIYQWYRDTDAIVGANTNKYTPVEADIGKTLKVTLTVGGSYSWDSALNKEESGVVDKAAGPAAPATPELSSKSYDYIEVYSSQDKQYAITQTQGSALYWTDGAMSTVGWMELSPNTTYYIYTRVKETETNYASAACTTPLEVTTDKYPVTGTVTISVSGGGDAEWGKTLTADTTNINPQSAVPYIIYSWYSGGTLVQSGTGSSYVTTESDFGKSVYVVVVVNDNPYTTPTPIQSNSITILAKTISGTAIIADQAADGAEWGSVVFANSSGIIPSSMPRTSITYAWSVEGTVKATGPLYSPASTDVGKTLTLTLGATGSYRGSVTTTTTIVKQTITAKPTVSGSPTFGTTISAALDAIPADARTNIGYQWYRSDTETGTGTAITGATSATYVVIGDDIGKWLYVAVTVDSANATYRGTTRSLAVEGGKEIITATIGISGSAKYDEELTITIGSLTPAGATYDVIWYRDDVQLKRGDGATLANTQYTLVKDDIGTVISATIIGTGNYTGTPTAATTATVTKADGPEKPAAPTAVSNTYSTITVTGITGYAYKIDSGSWGATRTSDGTFDFTGLSPNTEHSIYCYIPETDTHFASVSSDATVVTTLKQTITGSVSITGTLTYGETLSVNISGVLPAGAQAGLTYAWYRGDSAETATEAIGVTSSTLTLGASEVGKYIKVEVTGSGDYTGALSAVSSAAVAKANATAPDTPVLISKTYNSFTIASSLDKQYAATQTLGGTLNWIDGGGISTGWMASPNTTYYVYARLKETDTHNASPACDEPLIVTTDKQPITGTVTISGSTSYGDTLTAVITGISPFYARYHLTYQWFRMDGGGTVHLIPGATSQTYTITTDDIGCQINVAAIAETDSDYTGSVVSAKTATVTKKTISGSISITGSASYGDTLSVVIANVAPSGSQGTLTYQWQRYTGTSGVTTSSTLTTGSWQNIVGATNPTYTVTADDIGSIGGVTTLLRVVVTGDDVNYTGSLTSASVTPDKKLVSGTISITGTVRYGSTVTASDSVLPSGANADMSYRWFLDGTEVVGRTDSTFAIDDASWIGKTLTVEKYVSNTGSYYTGSVASAGKVIGKTVNPGTTVPVQVLRFDKTTITIQVVPGQIYSIDGGLTWTDETFDGVFSGLTPGQTYTIITKIPGSETVDDSTTLSLTMQTQPDAVNVTYEFYNGITGTVIVPSRVEIGTQATIQVIAPEGYKLTEIFDSMPNGVTLTAIGNDTFTFVAGKYDIRIFIAFTAIETGGGQTSSPTSSYTYSVPSTVTSSPSSTASTVSQTSSQTVSTGSDTSVPNMGMGGASNAAGIAIGLFGLLGIALVVIEKRRIKN